MFFPFSSQVENPFPDTDKVQVDTLGSTPAPPAVQVSAPSATLTANYYDSQIEKVKSDLSEFEPEINALISQIKTLTVDNDEAEGLIQDLGLKCDKAYKAIESLRKGIVEAPNSFVRSVNNLAKHYQERLDAGRRESKSKLGVYATAKIMEAQKAAEAERKAREEMQAKLDEEAAKLTAEAKAKDVEAKEFIAPKLPEAPPPQVSNTVRSYGGSSTLVKTWDFEITDPSQVPRAYLIVDEKAIRKAVKDGIREISGVYIFENTNVRFGK